MSGTETKAWKMSKEQIKAAFELRAGELTLLQGHFGFRILGPISSGISCSLSSVA